LKGVELIMMSMIVS